MAIKNAGKIEEVAGHPQYMFVKEKFCNDKVLYEEKTANNNSDDELEWKNLSN